MPTRTTTADRVARRADRHNGRMSQPEHDARRAAEDQRIGDAGQGDGLAEAVEGKLTGQGLEDEQDSADGEDASG